MQTQAQLRATVYNALLGDTALVTIIGDRLYTLGKNTLSEATDFPLITFSFFDTSAEYAFGGSSARSEDIIFQLNVYTDPGKINQMDAIIERIKAAMTSINYRNISRPIRFLEEDIDKIVRPVRWEIINV